MNKINNMDSIINFEGGKWICSLNQNLNFENFSVEQVEIQDFLFRTFGINVDAEYQAYCNEFRGNIMALPYKSLESLVLVLLEENRVEDALDLMTRINISEVGISRDVLVLLLKNFSVENWKNNDVDNGFIDKNLISIKKSNKKKLGIPKILFYLKQIQQKNMIYEKSNLLETLLSIIGDSEGNTNLGYKTKLIEYSSIWEYMLDLTSCDKKVLDGVEPEDLDYLVNARIGLLDLLVFWIEIEIASNIKKQNNGKSLLQTLFPSKGQFFSTVIRINDPIKVIQKIFEMHPNCNTKKLHSIAHRILYLLCVLSHQRIVDFNTLVSAIYDSIKKRNKVVFLQGVLSNTLLIRIVNMDFFGNYTIGGSRNHKELQVTAASPVTLEKLIFITNNIKVAKIDNNYAENAYEMIKI
ncbi:hypothetical protein BB559_004971 [Furculomyces boomerangus]|uniref:Uncharacterized protein n=2 Tax=Harpellales TaxID=61421 RepID=A0A2T9YBP4_9FUNG|nr:hypothetical protein BB559_004971 [Furculomyces boomerangus]PWA01859.1 hypothetical protein BB558_001986 [Smittium angustum]